MINSIRGLQKRIGLLKNIKGMMPNFIKYKMFNMQKVSFCSKNDDFPQFTKSDYFDDDELIINIGEKERFRGLLVICPTPIGNLNDISIRQYEAMKNGDILACEDTRKTGKLLELVQLKKMKEKFYSEFGVSFEEFVNRGGLDMTDEQVKKEFFENKDKKEGENNESGNTNSNTNTNKSKSGKDSENYYEFYQTEKDVTRETNYEERVKRYEDNQSKKAADKENEKKEIKPEESNVKQQADNSKNIKNRTKKIDLPNIIEQINLNYSEKQAKEVLRNLKLDEPITQEHYAHIDNSFDFYKKKKVIENSDEILKEFIDPIAESYDEKLNLSYKLRNRAKFIMNLNKKWHKYTKGEEDTTEKDVEEELEDELNLNSGLEDNAFLSFKKKIKEEKDKKGRGLLVPFNQENEEKKIPKLIKAMKLGLRIVLVSDAGTPTISDPGYRLVREASKQGIIIEALPGPSAVITALSASALPTDRFMFVGYLSKSPSEKREKIETIKKSGVTTVIFESPNRLIRTLETISEIFGEEHEIYVGLELTKRFENHLHGKVETVKKELEKLVEVKGEVTLIISPFTRSDKEMQDEKNLNDEIKIQTLDFGKKIISVIPSIKDKELKKIIREVCNVSSIKAGKIVDKVRERESTISEMLRRTNAKFNPNLKKPEEYLAEKNEGEGSARSFVKSTLNKNKK